MRGNLSRENKKASTALRVAEHMKFHMLFESNVYIT